MLGVINSYVEHGRIFKLLPYHSKVFLLKNRQQSVDNQRQYRYHRKMHQKKQQVIEQESNQIVEKVAESNPPKQYRWIDGSEKVNKAEENVRAK